VDLQSAVYPRQATISAMGTHSSCSEQFCTVMQKDLERIWLLVESSNWQMSVGGLLCFGQFSWCF
jgi:hypothetical protein